MRTIWKYPLAVENVQYVQMPRGARVIAAQKQGEMICLWALVESSADTEARVVLVAGTGHPLPENIADFKHVGTVQLHGGALVFHVFLGV
jgi:hypothetical protein